MYQQSTLLYLLEPEKVEQNIGFPSFVWPAEWHWGNSQYLSYSFSIFSKNFKYNV